MSKKVLMGLAILIICLLFLYDKAYAFKCQQTEIIKGTTYTEMEINCNVHSQMTVQGATGEIKIVRILLGNGLNELMYVDEVLTRINGV